MDCQVGYQLFYSQTPFKHLTVYYCAFYMQDINKFQKFLVDKAENQRILNNYCFQRHGMKQISYFRQKLCLSRTQFSERVLFSGAYGTGKTLLLIAKIVRELRKNPKDTVIIFGILSPTRLGNYAHTYFQDRVKPSVSASLPSNWHKQYKLDDHLIITNFYNLTSRVAMYGII